MEVYGRMEVGDSDVTNGVMDAMSAHELHNDGGQRYTAAMVSGATTRCAVQQRWWAALQFDNDGVRRCNSTTMAGDIVARCAAPQPWRAALPLIALLYSDGGWRCRSLRSFATMAGDIATRYTPSEGWRAVLPLVALLQGMAGGVATRYVSSE
ncbi:unnamed protein product [Sphagnum balticum]